MFNFLNHFVQVIATVYMKSGNKIVLKNLKSLDLVKTGSQVTELKWAFWGGNTVILNINVDEIEAVIAKRRIRWL